MPLPADTLAPTVTDNIQEVVAPPPSPSPPLTTTTYFKTSNTITNSDNTQSTIHTIKCPEGYVFEGSNALFSNSDEDAGIINHDGTHWLDLNGTRITNNNWTGSSITCKRQYCGSLGIVDSNKEYDVLVDNDLNTPQPVMCNEGYVFDVNSSRMGNVKCGVIPAMTGPELGKDNEVAWLVSNHLHDHLCESKTREIDCNDTHIPENISKDDLKLHDDPTMTVTVPQISKGGDIISVTKPNGEKIQITVPNDKGPGDTFIHRFASDKLKCTWIPNIQRNERGNTSGFNRRSATGDGTCKFIHRADINYGEPICRSMYCGNKPVPNSNRIDGQMGELPGPETGSMHGDCINFDGQIINNITNSSDCACFKHKSCDVCTGNDNCQWCGYKDDGSGGFCYSTRSHLDICRKSIRNDRGGTCTHVKTSVNKLNQPSNGWDKAGCENNVCVKSSYWTNLQNNQIETDQGITNYDLTKNTNAQCTANNNTWDNSARIQAPDHCILKNKNIGSTSITGGATSINKEYYPFTTSSASSTVVKLSISDYMCKPLPSPSPAPAADIQTLLNTCTNPNKSNKKDCEAVPVQAGGSCEWVKNPLRDSLYNWSANKKIIFKGQAAPSPAPGSPNCPIHKNTASQNNSNQLEFDILMDTPGYITLSNSQLNPSAITQSTLSNYNTTCGIMNINNHKNIFSPSQCSNISGTFHTTPHNCEAPGIRYCERNTKLNSDNSPACPSNSTITLGGRNVPGCRYYPDAASVPQNTPNRTAYKCYGGDVNYSCFGRDTGDAPYNCDKPLVGQNTGSNQTNCINTHYQASANMEYISNIDIFDTTTTNTSNDFIKNYVKCNTSLVGRQTGKELRCNMIGSDAAADEKKDILAHYGKLCTGPDNKKIPVKQICDMSDPIEGAIWGKYLTKGASGQLEIGCFKHDGTKYLEQDVCRLISYNATATQTGETPKIYKNYGRQSSELSLDLFEIILGTPLSANINKNDNIVQNGTITSSVAEDTQSGSNTILVRVKPGFFTVNTDYLNLPGINIKRGTSNTNRVSLINNTKCRYYIPPARSIILYKDTSPFLSAPVSKGDKVVQDTTSVGFILVSLPQNSKYIIIGNNPSVVTSDLFNTNSSLIINQGDSNNQRATASQPEHKYIVSSLINEPETCIIDYQNGTTETTEQILKNICEKSVVSPTINHKIGYTFNENNSNIEVKGQCKKINGTTPKDIKQLTQDVCTSDNKVFVKEYDYNNVATCGSLGSSKLSSQADIPTTWTGGEISMSTDGIHKSECSPSIMSSCSADCNPGYGGGGEYICQYNSRGGDVCADINRKDSILTGLGPSLTKQKLCESYPACVYSNNTCSHNSSIPDDGHLEWIGSPCYKIDNTAFSHGIAMLPELDKIIPPFFRVIMYMTVVMVFYIITIYIISNFMLKIIGKGVDATLNKTLDGTNKIIDAFTDADKILKLILAPQPTPIEKLLLLAGSIGLFIGTYHLFKYIREQVKDAANTGGGSLSSLFNKLRSINMKVPKNTPLLSHISDTGQNAATAGQNAAATVQTSASNVVNNITEDDANLTMIVQGAVGGLVLLIIILFAVKSDLIGKRTG